MTVQKKILDLTGSQYLVQKVKSAINDVDSSLGTHIADTDIHVTTADKNRWNNNTYVFRYSSTALTASSTNSNTLLDNTDNLKVDDKVIDSSGVLFSITAIDTQNSTFTIGTALIDLAQDSDVVHKSDSRSETISGYKTFSYNVTLYNSSASVNPVALFFKNKKVVMGSTTDIGSQNIAFRDSADTNLSILKTSCESVGNTSFEISVYNKDLNNQTVSGGMLISQTPANTYITPTTDNAVLFGSTNRRWSRIYGTEYYYGSNNVEFSTKFVTTDTAQTVSGVKTFSDVVPINGVYMGNEPSTSFRTVLLLRSRYDTAEKSGWLVSKFRSNSAQGALSGSDTVFLNFDVLENEVRTNGILRFNLSSWSGNTPGKFSLIPSSSIESYLGTSGNKWSAINGLSPSALGMPDLSNGIDISSYITVVANANKESLYTPPSNGWISVALTRTGGANMAVMLKQGNFASSGHNIAQENGTTTCNAMLPVKGGVQVSINSALADGIAFAYFYPCLGNV